MAMSQKTKKILNIVVDVIVFIILAFAIIFCVSIISSRASGYEGYTVIFGRSYLAVRTDSMEKDYYTGEVGEDNFGPGDLIIIRMVEGEEAQNLEVGTIITFKTTLNQDNTAYVLNTHRIIESHDGWYTTHGDNAPEGTNETVFVNDIVGIYEGDKIEGLGNFVLFMSSFGGFCTFVLVPSLLVVIYFAVNLVFVIKKEKAKQGAEAEEENQKKLAEEKERMRQEILAELAQQGNAPAADSAEHPSQGGQTDSPEEDE